MKQFESIIIASNHPFTNTLIESLAEHPIIIKRVEPELPAMNKVITESKAKAVFVDTRGSLEIMGVLYNSLLIKPLVFILLDKKQREPICRDYEKFITLRMPMSEQNVTSIVMTLMKKNIELTGDVKESIIDDSIASALYSGMISPEYVGYHYLMEAIKIYINNDDVTFNLRDKVYTELAKRHMTTLGSIEHGIRHSVHKCWEKSPNSFRARFFGTTGILMTHRPTSKEFIITVAEKLTRELREEGIL